MAEGVVALHGRERDRLMLDSAFAVASAIWSCELEAAMAASFFSMATCISRLEMVCTDSSALVFMRLHAAWE